MTVIAPGPEGYPTEREPGRLPGGDSSHAGGLAVWTEQSTDRCVLRLRGRLDAGTVPELDRHVDRLGCRWCEEVVVDLSRLDTMDSVGARLLVGFGHYAAGRGGRFEVVGASREVAALIAAAEVELSS